MSHSTLNTTWHWYKNQVIKTQETMIGPDKIKPWPPALPQRTD